MSKYHTTKIPISLLGEIRRMARKQLKGKWLRLMPPALVYVLLFTVPNMLFLLLAVLCSFDMRADIISGLNGTTASAADMVRSMITFYPPLSADATLRMILFLIVFFYISSVNGPFRVSFSELSLRILRGKEFSARTIFSGFRPFNKSFATGVKVILHSGCWLLLFLLLSIFFVSICVLINNFKIMILMVILFLLLLSGLTVRLAGYRMAYFIAADDDRSGTELERGFESVSESVRLMKGNRCTYCLLHLSFLPWFALLLPAGLTGGAIYMLSSVSSGAAVFLLSTLAIVFGVIFLTGSIFLMLYRRTVSAAFYSVITGNFHFAE